MKKAIKKAAWLLLTGLLLLNLVAALHAWKFTHFSAEATERIKPEQLSIAGKLNALAFGVDLPRPINDSQPSQPFETVSLQAEKQLETWHIKADSAKGTVILFHGYGGKKSGMLDKSDEFLRMGYSTLLVDFRGSGGSEGEQTTIGYKEAEEVKASFDFLKGKGENNIVLFGTSMGGGGHHEGHARLPTGRPSGHPRMPVRYDVRDHLRPLPSDGRNHRPVSAYPHVLGWNAERVLGFFAQPG
jgi:hypothetical protein